MAHNLHTLRTLLQTHTAHQGHKYTHGYMYIPCLLRLENSRGQ